MHVVITRPAGDANAWVEALNLAGFQALSLPLIDVGPVSDKQPVVQAWNRWSDWQAVMFVSAQAVRYFFDGQPEDMRSNARLRIDSSGSNGPQCWATGPGTHNALLQAGVPESRIDSPAMDAAQFDSEALWERVSGQVQVGKPVLIVRGQDMQGHLISSNGSGRDWLSQQLQAAGASAHFVVAYERRPPTWTQEQTSQARQAANDGSVWCFSSSQAIEHLAQALPLQSWVGARCVVTHERIASKAHTLGFGEVHTARPGLSDVLRSLESLA